MPVPASAPAFEQPVDPSDVQEFVVTLSQGALDTKPAPFLITGEAVASFVLAVSVEAAAAGLSIRSDSGYAPTCVGNKITFWPVIAAGQQSATIFDGDGVRLGVDLTITTNNVPPRIKQRTLVLRVAQQYGTLA
jgi:hypothetical protein